MNSLIDFAKHLEEQLAGADREPHWAPGEADRYMAEVCDRRRRFEEVATQLNETVIQPRLETFASYFVNANLTSNESMGHCECWFGYCERFPTSTKVAFTIEHDVRFENVAVCYDVSMTPLFIRFNEHDRLTLLLDEASEDRVADWVEERLSEFLDAYLRIDRGGEDFEDEPVTDPVCGMRIQRASAAVSDSYCGHPYFFCSKDCLAKFQEDQSQYVQIKTV
ncbi:MAG: YHS domain-containing protein [Planctomycetes bacterium]|nr:YHS domain-containing protein [Planctomycetota bacterium]